MKTQCIIRPFVLLLFLYVALAGCKKEEAPPPATNRSPGTQYVESYSADSDRDGRITPEDDLDRDGRTGENDFRVFKHILDAVGSYAPILEKLRLKPYLDGLEHVIMEGSIPGETGVADLNDQYRFVAVPLQSSRAAYAGYLMIGLDRRGAGWVSHGMYQSKPDLVTFFNADQPGLFAVNPDTYEVFLLGDDYWSCAAECVEEALDGAVGSLCASLCAVCIVEPSKVSCGACLLCLGSTVAGCLFWCAW